MRYVIGCLAVAVGLASGSAWAEKIEVGFSPCWAGRVCALDLVLKTIDSAQPGKPLLVAAYGLTSRPFGKALIAAAQRGVKVRVIADAKANRRGGITRDLSAGGIPVRYSDRYAIMHNKFMVVGGDTVETGSFNFTSAATNRNAENVMIITGNRAVASQYRQEWQRLWDEAE